MKRFINVLTAALRCGALLVLGLFFMLPATPALAEDGESVIDDTYIAPLDEDGSDESLREQGGSGFDTPGPVSVDEDYYNDTESGSDDGDE